MARITKGMVRRIARQADSRIGPLTRDENAALMKEEDELRKKLIQEAQLVVAKNLWEKLRRAFTPKGVPFFRLYVKMKAFELGAEPMPDGSALKAMFKQAVVKLNSITSPIDKRPLSASIVNMVAMARPTLESLLVRLPGASDNDRLWKEFARIYSNLFVEVAKDKQVYIRALLRGSGPRKWAYLRKMSPKQEWVEKLKDDDPESYAIIQESGETLKKINDRIARRIKRDPDVELQRGYLMGKPVQLAVHRRTGEEMVYDIDGSILPVDDWKEKRKEKLEAQKKLRDPDLPLFLEGMQEFPDWIVDNLPGDVKWASLSDDQAKSGRLTRIYPTKTMYDFRTMEESLQGETRGYQIIVDGKYKGRLLDEMVNTQGRLMEGTEYDYNPKTERTEEVQKSLTKAERTKQALIQWSERCDMLKEQISDEDPPEQRPAKDDETLEEEAERLAENKRALVARKRWDVRNARLDHDCELIDTMMVQTTPATPSQKKKWRAARSFLGRQLKQYGIEREESPFIKRDPSVEEPYVTMSNVKVRRGKRTTTKKMLYISIGPDRSMKEQKLIMRHLAVNAANKTDAAIAGSVSTIMRSRYRKQIDGAEQLLEMFKAEEPRREKQIQRVRKYLKLLNTITWKKGTEETKTEKQQKLHWERLLMEDFDFRHKPKGGRHKGRYEEDVETEGERDGFWFDPKDFATIREALGGMSLSAGALKEVEQHFKDLAAAEQATVREDPSYLMDNIGGFKAEYSRKVKDENGNQIYVAKNKDGHWAEVPEGTSGSKPKIYDMLLKQQQAMAWLDTNGGQGVCALETGVGKCVRSDTLISTNQGLVPIKSMAPPGIMQPDTAVPVEGWSVVVNGEMLPVKQFYYGGPKPTIKVRTRRGYEIEGSRVHPLLVRTPDGQETWVKTPDLEAGDHLCVERQEGVFSSTEPTLDVPRREDFHKNASSLKLYSVPDRMTPELGRFLGYLVAEGWVNGTNTFSISQCPEKNPTVRQDIEQLLQSLLGWEAQPEKDIFIHSTFLREYLHRMGVEYELSRNKTVPEVLFGSTKETVRNFLQAFIDAEGSVDARTCRSCIEFSTASEQLGREVQVLLLQFGILCSRRPKYVKGYDHTYWRLTITGEDALAYRDKIGFVSRRKQAAIENVPEHRNTNLDVVPHLATAMGDLWDDMLIRFGSNISAFRRKMGSASFDTTVRHIRMGRRNPSYTFIKTMLREALELGCGKHPAFQTLENVYKRRLFYDPIEVLEESEAIVMDIEVEDPSHCFVGNGLVNHNTLVGIGTMQRLKRDGMLEPGASYTDEKGQEVELNGRFLWVCPKTLKGNVGEEMKNWLTKEGATDLDNRVDVMAYEQFRTAMGKMTYPSKNATHMGFWEGRKWEPKRYVACFFDEAHVLAKDPSTKLSRAAQKLVHPRKIMLTASPMKNEPMQAYILSAIASNKPLRGRGSEDNRLEMRRFKKRFVETVGGRALGVKDDPEVVRELQTWVKRNIFHADKEKVVEYILPHLDDSTQPIEMPKEAEQVYRDITKTFEVAMRGLVGKFRDLKVNKNTKDERVEKVFGQKFKPVVKLLTNMANDPGRAFIEMAEMVERGGVFNSKGELVPIPKPISALVQEWVKKLGGPAGVRQMIQDTTHEVVDANGNTKTVQTYLPGPKIESATETVKNRIDETNSRSILFSDDPDLCLSTGRHLAKTVSGNHAVGLKDTIHLFSEGKELKKLVIPLPTSVIDALVKDPEERKEWYKRKVATHKLPFKKRMMKMYPGIPAEKKKGLNPHAESDKWQVWVLKHIVSADPAFRTVTLYGQAYSEGHNLQSFDTVIHLDRDTWNNEHMKQRTARAWRQGQKNQVKEVTLDATYSSHDDRGRRLSQQDETLDQIRDHFSKVEGKLFDAIIKESQGTVLGKEWLDMEKRDASTLRLGDKHRDLMLSPYSDRSKTRGEA